ncbi:MAG: hypothetical protein DRQ01_01915 [Ignavibacteriae bacterium]|nr:MAG: hypothetical protein DRQ01_01915 [Ignavibacteriota bacterium]
MNSLEPLITNDAIVFGLLMTILMVIFKTSNSSNPVFVKFYKYIPALLLCYFIPSIFNSMGIIDGEQSKLYFVASRYLLPASLALLTLSVDLKEIKKLGFKAIIMFFAGTVGIIIGGPIAILLTSIVAPDVIGGVGPDAVWRGMVTIAGSWIGGGANQAAMYEMFKPSNDLYSTSIAVDVIVANIWMAFLLFGAARSAKVDKYFKADASAIDDVKNRVEAYRASIVKIPTLTDVITVLSIGFIAAAIGHIAAGIIAPYIEVNYPFLIDYSLTSPFFWIVITATIVGLFLSFTKAKELEGVGASRIGSAMIYILVATIGMKMNVLSIFDKPGFFLVGALWLMIHVTVLIIVAKLIKAPFFFVAVGSQANVGGAASAPIVAAAFHPSLAPVGVLLAVMGYTLGTLGAYFCGILMQIAAP